MRELVRASYMTKYFALGNLEAVAGAVQVPGGLQARGAINNCLQQFRQLKFELPHNSFLIDHLHDLPSVNACIRELTHWRMFWAF